MNMQAGKNFTACRVCQRKLLRLFLMSGDHIFCYEHKREFKRRQREGVGTAELDPLWSDTLKNWRERPPELHAEAKSQFLATPFTLRQKVESWLLFERSYRQIRLTRRGKAHRTIYNPRKNFGYRFKKQRLSFHRLSDYIAFDTQTGAIRRFVDVALNEVTDDLQGIRPAPAQEDLAKFWGKRKPHGIGERNRRHFHQQ